MAKTETTSTYCPIATGAPFDNGSLAAHHHLRRRHLTTAAQALRLVEEVASSEDCRSAKLHHPVDLMARGTL